MSVFVHVHNYRTETLGMYLTFLRKPFWLFQIIKKMLIHHDLFDVKTYIYSDSAVRRTLVNLYSACMYRKPAFIR
jgi:hypothetical protein